MFQIKLEDSRGNPWSVSQKIQTGPKLEEEEKEGETWNISQYGDINIFNLLAQLNFRKKDKEIYWTGLQNELRK